MTNPKLNPTVLLSLVEDGYVAYDPGADRLHQLNPIAALIAELCDGSRNVDEVRRLAAPLLPQGKAGEIDRWIAQATEVGLIVRSESPAHGPRELTAAELTDLAKRLRQHGKNHAAFLCRKRVVEIDPDDAEAWSALGDIAHILGRREDERAAFERYLALRPDDAEVRHLVVALRDEPPPERAPDECIRKIYQGFSSYYDAQMCEELAYEGPQRIRDAICSVIGGRRGLSVLDLGCGSGLSGLQLKASASRLVGVDISPEMVELAKRRNIYDRLDVAEITDWLSRNTEPFDVVLCADCLIYFGDLCRVVKGAVERLNPDGVFAFSMERGDRFPFRLTDSGRYTHHPDHVRDAAAQAGAHVALMEEAFLRMEYGAPVTGLFAVLTKDTALALQEKRLPDFA